VCGSVRPRPAQPDLRLKRIAPRHRAADRAGLAGRSPTDTAADLCPSRRGFRYRDRRRLPRALPSGSRGQQGALHCANLTGMRFVIYGAGAIGGVVGARLFQNDNEVLLIARGPHHDILRSQGLRIQDPHGAQTLPIPVVDHPVRIHWQRGDVALVAVKSHHSPEALTELAAVAPPELPVVCLQNGVRNEPEALRRFANVYGVPVACPTAHLEPGVVRAYSTPVTGILDVGRYPGGVDETAVAIAAAFRHSTFDAKAVPDVARWKWRKLITNLPTRAGAGFGRSTSGRPMLPDEPPHCPPGVASSMN